MALNAKSILLFDNRCTDASFVATSEASGFPIENAIDLRIYKFWKATSTATQYLTIDCEAVKSADTLGIMGHNLFTADSLISVWSSSNGSWAGEQIERLAGFTPGDDTAVLKTFASASARYWRVKIDSNAVAPYIAVIMLGERLTMEKYIAGDSFDPAPERSVMQSNINAVGNHLGTIIERVELRISVEFRNLTDSWVVSTFRPAWDDYISLRKPCFWVWDITNHPDEVYLVRIADNFRLSMPYTPTRRSLSLQFRALKET